MIDSWILESSTRVSSNYSVAVAFRCEGDAQLPVGRLAEKERPGTTCKGTNAPVIIENIYLPRCGPSGLDDDNEDEDDVDHHSRQLGCTCTRHE